MTEQAVVASLLQKDRIPLEDIKRKYKSTLGMLRAVLGSVPQSMCYFAVSPTGFETQALIFPNSMNMPAVLTRPKMRKMIGLAALGSTRYGGGSCAATHGVVFALRCGVGVNKVSNVVRRPPGVFTERELAVLSIVERMSQQIPVMTAEDRVKLERWFGKKWAEFLVASVCFMGFLDKFLGGIVSEVDQEVADIAQGLMAQDGWSPGIHSWLLDPTSQPVRPPRIPLILLTTPHAPAALSFERPLLRGVPSKWPAVGNFLVKHTGHNFPFLQHLTNNRVRRAIAATLAMNLSADKSIVGLMVKSLAGVIFAHRVQCSELQTAIKDICNKTGVSAGDMEKALNFATNSTVADSGFDNRQVHALLELAKAISDNPPAVTRKIEEDVRTSDVAPSVIVELVIWISVLEYLNRLCAFLRC